jgi:hypothetical protein
VNSGIHYRAAVHYQAVLLYLQVNQRKILRIYLDTSVIGGYFDDEFKKGIYKPIISSHVIAELEGGAPEYIKENLKTIGYEEHAVSDDMIKLAEKYMEQEIVSKKYYGDALMVVNSSVIGRNVEILNFPPSFIHLIYIRSTFRI